MTMASRVNGGVHVLGVPAGRLDLPGPTGGRRGYEQVPAAWRDTQSFAAANHRLALGCRLMSCPELGRTKADRHAAADQSRASRESTSAVLSQDMPSVVLQNDASSWPTASITGTWMADEVVNSRDVSPEDSSVELPVDLSNSSLAITSGSATSRL